MERPALTGISDYQPFPRWRLLLLLGVLVALGVICTLMFRKDPPSVPWMGGFIFLHWTTPCLLVLAASIWTYRRWGQPDRNRGTFWGLLVSTAVLVTASVSWFTVYRHFRELNHFVYSSRVEYVRLTDPPKDWLDPAHPQVYEVGAGLRLAMSPVIWTDGLHRTLPRSIPSALEPYPEASEARPLSERGLSNLSVLMKTCALIRFFHPTDAARFDNWARLIAQGVRRVEGAPTAEELAKRIQSLLAPYAPQARLLLPGEPVPVIPVPEGARLLARWRHVGAGFAAVNQRFTGPTTDRSAQLAAVGMSWSTFQHFYPYWDVVQVDWAAVLPSALREAAQATTHEAYYDVIKRLNAQTKDGHAWVDDLGLPPLGFADISLQVLDGRVLVAKRWGQAQDVRLGGEVLSVDGEPIAQVMARGRAMTPTVTPGIRDNNATGWMLAGKPEATLDFEIADLAGAKCIHHLIAQNPQSRRTRPDPIREIKPGLLLVELGRISQEEFQKALPRLVDAKGLIFDHRGYPSHGEFLKHFRNGPLEGIQMHIPVSLLPNGEGRTYLSQRWVTLSKGPTYRGRVAVLLGGDHNISAAETFLEVVAANHLAPLVGRPTAGTNGNIQEFTLPGNLRGIITGMRVLKGDGSQHHGIGILPTHPVKHTREALAAGRDEDVERALALLETGL
jgi:hypothetical protein